MILAISQRQVTDRGGMDALEQSYARYFGGLGLTLIPVPNDAVMAARYCNEHPIDAIVLSGGGDIQPILYGDDATVAGNYAPTRDATERILLTIALERDIPVLGICRGMEFINAFFGGRQHAATANELQHDETRHVVSIVDEAIHNVLGTDSFEVNSYHRTVIGQNELAGNLQPFATAGDNTIEGFYHPKHAVAAIIWHPEREAAPHTLNDFLVHAFLARKLYWHKREGASI